MRGWIARDVFSSRGVDGTIDTEVDNRRVTDALRTRLVGTVVVRAGAVHGAEYVESVYATAKAEDGRRRRRILREVGIKASEPIRHRSHRIERDGHPFLQSCARDMRVRSHTGLRGCR